VFHRRIAEMGIPFSDEQCKAAERWVHYYWAQSPELADDLRKFGSSDNGDFWRQHSKRQLQLLGIREDEVEELSGKITEAMQSEYEWKNCVPEDIFPTLSSLRDAGLRLGVVSNRHEEFTGLLEEIELLDFFEMTLAAGEVGWWKPDPRILQHAVELFNTQPESAIYVGDNYYADVVGARAAGLVPVLVDPFTIYPSPDCIVIKQIGEFEALLGIG
jgi:HAD superfamily hydrolase (TIGR01549 family)